MSRIPEDATITIPAEQLYLLGLTLAEAVRPEAGNAPEFAHGWLSCCEAIKAVGDEQARKGLTT